MKELNFETPDISIIKSIKSGIKIIINNIKTISLGLAIPTLLFALIATVTICGNVGVVKIDYNHYMPYHEISELFLAKYIIGTLVSVVLFMLWRGYTFHYLSNFDKEKKAFCVKTSRISDFFYSGLRFIQFCLLAFIVFGIIGAILAYISITVSAWLWTAFIIYAVFVSVPLYISGYEYMLNDINFRKALKTAAKRTAEQWGRVFLRLLLVNTAAIILVVILTIPAATLGLSLYDNATAVVMTGASSSPVLIYIMEYIAVFIASVLVLYIILISTSVLMFFLDDANKYSAYLAQARLEDR